MRLVTVSNAWELYTKLSASQGVSKSTNWNKYTQNKDAINLNLILFDATKVKSLWRLKVLILKPVEKTNLQKALHLNLVRIYILIYQEMI